MYQNIDLPAGIKSNGTQYQKRGAWRDGDRIRWHNGLLRPIGGWVSFGGVAGDLDQVLTDPTTEAARALLVWEGNDGTPYYAVGYNKGVKAFNEAASTVYDITPAAFVARVSGPAIEDGYGDWFYGSDAYDTARLYETATAPIFNWCFRNWGENLLMAERGAPSNLYEWDLTLAAIAVPVANSPTDFDCFHVTDQRIVMVAGTSTEPRLVTWCDSEDNTAWTPAVTNQAGFQTLSGAGRFQEIVNFQNQILLISENDAWRANYLGPPYIFGFDRVGDDCGIEAAAAVATTEAFVVWPGRRSFFLYDGNAVQPLNCDVMDEVSTALEAVDWSKTTSFVNAAWSEIWWFFQSQASTTGEPDTYITWNYKDKHWTTGTIPRTVGYGGDAGRAPVMMGSDGYIYRHEQDGVIPSVTASTEVFAETAPIELRGGNNTQYISAILPDFISTGEVDVYLIGQDAPSGPEISFGPYTISYPATSSQPIPTRARGHTVRLRVQGKSGTWSLGSLRLDFVNNGGKK